MSKARRVDRVVLGLDTEAPTAPSTVIAVSEITATGFTISWESATDNQTEAKSILYKVYLTNYSDPDDDWHLVANYMGLAGTCKHVFTGLESATTYAFYIEASDESGNVLTYPGDGQAMSATTIRAAVRPPSTTVTRPETGNTYTRPTSNNTVTRPSSTTVTRPETGNTYTRPTSNNTVTRPSSTTVTRPESGNTRPTTERPLDSGRVDYPIGKAQWMDSAEETEDPSKPSRPHRGGTRRR